MRWATEWPDSEFQAWMRSAIEKTVAGKLSLADVNTVQLPKHCSSWHWDTLECCGTLAGAWTCSNNEFVRLEFKEPGATQ